MNHFFEINFSITDHFFDHFFVKFFKFFKFQDGENHFFESQCSQTDWDILESGLR